MRGQRIPADQPEVAPIDTQCVLEQERVFVERFLDLPDMERLGLSQRRVTRVERANLGFDLLQL